MSNLNKTAPPRDLRNQCDGCAQGLELRGWSHYKDGLPWVRCTGYEYAPAPSADRPAAQIAYDAARAKVK